MKNFILTAMLLVAKTLPAADHQILVYDNRFSPEVTVLNSGDNVQWQVVSGFHQIVAGENSQGIEFSSPALSVGDQFTSVVTGSGGEVYFHSSNVTGMQGALVIEQPVSQFVIDEKINAAFHNPNTPGQGLLFEYVPSSEVLIAYWFTYSKAGDSQLWLIATGVAQGNRADLTVLKPTGGQLNQAQATTNEPWGELSVEFSDCYHAQVYFNANNDQHSGNFPIERLYLGQACESGDSP